MVAEVFAGVSALKAAFDLAKGLKDIDDATRRNAAVIELQEKILSAQATQSELVETVSELKRLVAELETWEAEKQRYELHEIVPGGFCYRIKESMRAAEPTHYLCANCYSAGQKKFLSQTSHGPDYIAFKCHSCGLELSHSRLRSEYGVMRSDYF